MGEVRDLTAHRALSSQNCGLWSPRDALVEMIRRIDDGEADLRNIIILGVANGEDDDRPMLERLHAQTTHEEAIALLNVALLDAIKSWAD